MRKLILDTNVLIKKWTKDALWKKSAGDVKVGARELIRFYDTDAIATPVYIELIAGMTKKHDLELMRLFLKEFTVVDEGNIIAADWKEAQRLAARIPRNGRPRQLGDCLLLAIANRLNYEVFSFDAYF